MEKSDENFKNNYRNLCSLCYLCSPDFPTGRIIGNDHGAVDATPKKGGAVRNRNRKEPENVNKVKFVDNFVDAVSPLFIRVYATLSTL